jgi:hypothetical protein
MHELTVPLDWEVGAKQGSGLAQSKSPSRSSQPLAAAGASAIPLRPAARANHLAVSAALRHEVARTARLGALDESPRPTDVSGYARADSSFFLSQYDIYGERIATRVRHKVEDHPSMRKLRAATVAADGALLGSSGCFELPWDRHGSGRAERALRSDSAEQSRLAELERMSMEDRELWLVAARSGRLTAAVRSSHEKAARLREQMRHWDESWLRRLRWAWERWAVLVARARRSAAAQSHRPRTLMQGVLAAFQRCHWRAQPKQRLLIGLIRTCSRPHLTRALRSWQAWAIRRDQARATQERLVRRVLHKTTAPVFDCWVELLETKRRRLQRARGVILRLQERGLSRSWARWCQYVGQMR